VQEALVTRAIYGNSLQCVRCEEILCGHVPLVIYQIKEATRYDGVLILNDILTSKGVRLWAPHWIHEQCWEDAERDLRDAREQKDVPFVEGGAACVAYCDVCRAPIDYEECVSTAEQGVLVLSDRAPSGAPALEWDPIRGTPVGMYCMECTHVITDHLIEKITWQHLEDGHGSG
jgi:hypothetical protein